MGFIGGQILQIPNSYTTNRFPRCPYCGNSEFLLKPTAYHDCIDVSKDDPIDYNSLVPIFSCGFWGKRYIDGSFFVLNNICKENNEKNQS